MGVLEAVVAGLFGIIQTALVIGALLLLMPAMGRWFNKHMNGAWNARDGHLGAFDPRRLWCKHPVASYGPGAHGLWAVWCEYCGRKLGGR